VFTVLLFVQIFGVAGIFVFSAMMLFSTGEPVMWVFMAATWVSIGLSFAANLLSRRFARD